MSKDRGRTFWDFLAEQDGMTVVFAISVLGGVIITVASIVFGGG